MSFFFENDFRNWSWLYEGHFSSNALSLKNVYTRLGCFFWSYFLCEPHVIRSCIEGPVFSSPFALSVHEIKRSEQDRGGEKWNAEIILENAVTNFSCGAFMHSPHMLAKMQIFPVDRVLGWDQWVNSAKQGEQFSSSESERASENVAAQWGPRLWNRLYDWLGQ